MRSASGEPETIDARVARPLVARFGAAARADAPVPLWLVLAGLAAAGVFTALAATASGGAQAIALLSGAAAAGGLGLFGLIERLARLGARPEETPAAEFAAMLDAAPEPSALVDRSGRIRALNAAARGLRDGADEARGFGGRAPERAEDLLAGVDGARAQVFRLLRDAFKGRALRRSLERAGRAPLTLDVWPAGPGLTLWRWSGAEPVEPGLEAPVVEAAADDAEYAWFRMAPSGRIVASNPWFERWIAGGPAEGRRPSFHTVFPEAETQLRAGEGVGGLVETTRMVSGPDGPRTVSLMLAPSVDGAGASGVAIRKRAARPADATSASSVGSALEALDSAQLFEDAPIGLLLLAPDGAILRVNAAADRLLTDDGAAEAPSAGAAQARPRAPEPLGSALLSWVHPDDRAELAARLAAAGVGEAGAGPSFEARLAPLRGPAAEPRYAQCLFSRVDTARGRLLVGFLIDASELRRLEQSFNQGQKLAAVGQLAGGVAHDFNNLLQVILGSCESLAMIHDADDPSMREISEIEQSANRAARLVKQLLAYSRRQNLEPRRANLSEQVSELSSMLKRLIGPRIELGRDLAEDLWPVRVDVGQFEQVVTNLVVNARDAMTEGGRIRIVTRNERLSVERPGLGFSMPPGDYVAIDVADDGCGMDDETLARVFEPFFTTKPVGQGTGLGLSTVYGIVKQSGGYVFVDSALGRGTTFRIYLPRLRESVAADPRAVEAAETAPLSARAGGPDALSAAFDAVFGASAPSAADRAPRRPRADFAAQALASPAAAPKPAPSSTPTSTPPSRARRAETAGRPVLLVVEDEAPIRALAARHLTSRGYVVHEAEDAEAALELLFDDTLHIDVMLSDVVMPSMDGAALLRALGDRRPEMSVVFMSGHTRDAFADTLDSALRGGRSYGFLQKPFKLDALVAAVERARATG